MPSNLTLTGSPTFTTAATGFGQALTLNGSSQYAIPASGTPLAPAGASTFTIRFRFLTSANPGAHVLLSAMDSDTPNIVIYMTTGGVMGLFVRGFNGSADMSGGSGFNDGQWHDCELVVNQSAGTAKLFLDGSIPSGLSASSGSYAPSAAGSVRQGIGVQYDNTVQNHFAGKLDEIAVFNTALHTTTFTPASTPIANNASGLVALWHCDSGQVNGATLLDCAGATFTVSPTSGGATQALTFTGSGTQWTTKNPAFSISGSGNTIGSTTVTTSTAGSATLSAVGTAGVMTITDQSSGHTQSFSAALVQAITLDGPTFGFDGAASATFTVTLSSPASGAINVVVDDGAASGTFAPSTPQIGNGATTTTFTYTPSGPGLRTITATPTGITAAARLYTAFSAGRVLHASVAPYGPSYPDYAASLGVTVYDASGALLLARTTGQTSECGTDTGIYIAAVPIEPAARGVIIWDAPAGAAPFVEALNPDQRFRPGNFAG